MSSLLNMYVANFTEGCELMVQCIIAIRNMKKYKIGCIPFQIEDEIQSVLEAAYELSKVVVKELSHKIDRIPEQDPQNRVFFPPVPKDLDLGRGDQNVLDYLEDLIEKVLKFFDKPKKEEKRRTIIEYDEIMKEIEEVGQFDEYVLDDVFLPKLQIYTTYALNFRNHGLVNLQKLDLVWRLFPSNPNL